jgi:hypothetical protein
MAASMAQKGQSKSTIKGKPELPEPNDLVFLAEQSIRVSSLLHTMIWRILVNITKAMDMFKANDIRAAEEFGEELIILLRQKEGLSLFRRAIIELLISEVSSGRLSGDKFGDPRAHAFESMQVVAKLWEYGIPPDLESAVQFVEQRAQKIGMPYVQERVKEEAGWRKENWERKRN